MPMPFGLPPPDPGFELFVASHGMSQGLLQTIGAQTIPRATIRIGDVQVGGLWRNISNPLAGGVAIFFVRVGHQIGKTQVEAGAAYRIRTGVKVPHDSEAWEYSAAVRRKFGRIGLRAIVEYSPKEFEAGKSLYVEAGPNVDIARGMSLFANIGRRERDGGADYTSFNVGISKVVRHKLVLDGRYYATDRSELGIRYRGRIVFSARLTL